MSDPEVPTRRTAAEDTPWHRDMEAMAPSSIDEARLFMVHELHEAVFGSTWARPESPGEVWRMLLGEVRRLRAVVSSPPATDDVIERAAVLIWDSMHGSIPAGLADVAAAALAEAGLLAGSSPQRCASPTGDCVLRMTEGPSDTIDWEDQP